jgi:hypothetical protein
MPTNPSRTTPALADLLLVGQGDSDSDSDSDDGVIVLDLEGSSADPVPLRVLLDTHQQVDIVWPAGPPAASASLAAAPVCQQEALSGDRPTRRSGPVEYRGASAVRQIANDLYTWHEHFDASELDDHLRSLARLVDAPLGVAASRHLAARGLADLRRHLPAAAAPGVDDASAALSLCATTWRAVVRFALADEPPLARCVRVAAVARDAYRQELLAQRATERLRVALDTREQASGAPEADGPGVVVRPVRSST